MHTILSRQHLLFLLETLVCPRESFNVSEAFSLCRVPYTIFLFRLFIAKINDSPEVLRRDIDEKAKWPIRMAIVGVVVQELLVFPKFTPQECLRHLYAFLLAGI